LYPLLNPPISCPSVSLNNIMIFGVQYELCGARGSVVGGGTMLQAGRSRVHVPMRWIFSIYLIHPAAVWSWGRPSL
jgi:hypothetical protein